jgi:hypothetical protein
MGMDRFLTSALRAFSPHEPSAISHVPLALRFVVFRYKSQIGTVAGHPLRSEVRGAYGIGVWQKSLGRTRNSFVLYAVNHTLFVPGRQLFSPATWHQPCL